MVVIEITLQISDLVLLETGSQPLLTMNLIEVNWTRTTEQLTIGSTVGRRLVTRIDRDRWFLVFDVELVEMIATVDQRVFQHKLVTWNGNIGVFPRKKTTEDNRPSTRWFWHNEQFKQSAWNKNWSNRTTKSSSSIWVWQPKQTAEENRLLSGRKRIYSIFQVKTNVGALLEIISSANDCLIDIETALFVLERRSALGTFQTGQMTTTIHQFKIKFIFDRPKTSVTNLVGRRQHFHTNWFCSSTSKLIVYRLTVERFDSSFYQIW